jgi:hypothetical protein
MKRAEKGGPIQLLKLHLFWSPCIFISDYHWLQFTIPWQDSEMNIWTLQALKYDLD